MAAVISGNSFFLADWYVEPALNRISRDDEIVKIDPQNMKVLELLASKPGEVFSQAQIEEVVWKDVVVTSNSVYQSIAQLRKALGDERSKPRYIETIAKKGYRLLRAAQLNLANDPTQCASSAAAQPKTRRTLTTQKRAFMRAAILAAVLLVGVGVLAGMSPSDEYAYSPPIEPSAQFGSPGETARTRVERLQYLARVAIDNGKPHSAVHQLEVALAQARAAAKTENDSGVGRALVDLAEGYLWLDEAEKAELGAREALEVFRHSGSMNLNIPDAHVALAQALTFRGQYEEAETHALQAERLYAALRGENHGHTMGARSIRAVNFLFWGKLEQAESIAREALHEHETFRPTELVEIAHQRDILSHILLARGDYAGARQQAEAALQEIRLIDKSHVYVPYLEHILGEALLGIGEHAAAERSLRSSLSGLRQRQLAAWRIGRVASVLAQSLAAQGKSVEAKGYFSEASRLLEGATAGPPLQALLRHRTRVEAFEHVGTTPEYLRTAAR